MGKYQLEFRETAEKDLAKHKKAGNKGTIKKIEKILHELEEHPYTGTGNPEQLKHELSGYWSRRINQKDRLIYSIQEEVVTVLILSAMGHYLDK
jgi:toxin YoeB